MQPGQIWQSAFRNWVYESGVVLNDTLTLRGRETPLLCSGVFISGIFKATAPTHPQFDPAFKHTIDYINGRVIFDTPVALHSTMQSDFAYKHVRIDFRHVLNNQFTYSVLASKYTTNPLTSNNLVYPSGFAQPFPAVFIDVDDRTWQGYELGNRSLISTDTVRFEVWALDDLTRDNVVDILGYQMRKTFAGIDFNIAPLPLSGIFNTLSPEYIPYQVMVSSNPGVSGLGFPNFIKVIQYRHFIKNTRPINEQPHLEFERSTVNYEVETMVIMPNLPLGINVGTFQFNGAIIGF